LGGHQQPIENGIDCYKKQFTYSNDPFNLLLTEKEDNGKEIENLYVSGTDLLSAKYIKDRGAIKFRQFFFYDGNSTLLKVIKDDGSTRSCDDFTDISQRLITHCIPQQRRRPYGLPERIEQLYWDSSRGCEVLLKRIDCEYTAEGRRCLEHHFDANGQHCYTLSWQYDAHGNVKEEINALGHRILRNYDENDNLIVEQGPGLNESTEYSYDRANRLISLKKHADGQCLVTQHRYDYRGSRTATIDHFGETTHFHYDALGRLFKTEHPPILHTEDWILSPTSEITYDFENRPIEINDSKGKTTITYNARGKPVTKTQPDGTVERLVYQLDGSLAKTIAPSGVETRYTRDFLGRILEEETYDASGQFISRQSFAYQGSNLLSKIDVEGCVTTYAYDGAGRLISETCGSSYKTVEYDSLGRPAKVKQWYGNSPDEITVKTLRYDFLNQVREERLEDSAENVL
jgi:YD repeat-containing protein